MIVDDDCLVTGALKTILETRENFHVPACENDGKILKQYPDARILLLTTFSDDEYIIKALKL